MASAIFLILIFIQIFDICYVLFIPHISFKLWGKTDIVLPQALTVIEYLVARGSERAVDDIVEHTYQISVRIFFCL